MLRTRIVWTGVAGTPYYTTFHWAGDSPALAEAAQLATIDFLTTSVGVINPLIRGTIEPEVLNINPATGELIQVFTAAGSTSIGVGTGEPLPFQIQARTTLQTAGIRNGRRVNGSSYFPGLSEQANADGAGPVETIRESIQARYTDDLLGSTAVLVVWSRPSVSGGAGATNVVTGATTSSVWSQLRTRRAS